MTAEGTTPVPSYNRKNVIFAALSLYTLYTAAGMVISWASPAIPKLKEENTNFTDTQYHLLASIMSLAPGPMVSILCVDTIGRRWSIWLIWVTIFIGHLMMLLTKNVYALLTARFISGFGMGAAFSVIGIYISETADVQLRGPLKSASTLFVTFGVLVSYAVGPFVSFSTFMMVVFGFSSVFGVLWFFLPESPYFLVAKGEIGRARGVLKHFRQGASPDAIAEEFSIIKNGIEEERRVKSGFRKLFTSRAVFKELVTAFYILYIQQGAGLNPITGYAQELFDKAQLGFNGAYVPIGLVLASVVTMLLSPLLVRRYGFRNMFLVSGFGSAILLICMGVYFAYLEAGNDISSIRYISIVLDLLLMNCVYLGLGGNVWGMVSELFPPSVSGYANGICGIFSTFLGFVSNQTFGELKDKYGFGYAFLGFGVVQLFASAGLFFIVDTSKMTLQEIQDHFEGKKSTKVQKEAVPLKNMDAI